MLALGRGGIEEARLEDYVVSGLVDFDDVSYDDHADLLYDLAGQTVQHFRSYLSEDETRKVLRCLPEAIAQFIHAQMQEHYWEEAAGYEVVDQQGFHRAEAERLHRFGGRAGARFPSVAADKSNMAKYLFGGFARCLYPVQKFQSDASAAGGHPGSRIVEVVQAGQGPVPDLLQVGRRSSRIPAGLRGRDGRRDLHAGAESQGRNDDAECWPSGMRPCKWCERQATMPRRTAGSRGSMCSSRTT